MTKYLTFQITQRRLRMQESNNINEAYLCKDVVHADCMTRMNNKGIDSPTTTGI
uniref:Uncharacterized protein n=1 Tax=Rhizophora mucronata TaxID=61149 RepID=A0A2P2PX60_RHIMU